VSVDGEGDFDRATGFVSKVAPTWLSIGISPFGFIFGDPVGRRVATSSTSYMKPSQKSLFKADPEVSKRTLFETTLLLSSRVDPNTVLD
jgi:hypothetical protein